MSQKTDFSKLSAPYLSFEQIQSEVDKIFKELCILTIPINSEVVAEKLGFNVIPYTNLIGETSVEALLVCPKKEILVDFSKYMNDNYWPRIKFSIAHELGHYILHKKIFEEICFNGLEEWLNFQKTIPEKTLYWLENHANEFAGRLIVPTTHLKKEALATINAIQSEFENGLIDDLVSYAIILLSRKFEVSSGAIKIRLDREGITQKLCNQVYIW